MIVCKHWTSWTARGLNPWTNITLLGWMQIYSYCPMIKVEGLHTYVTRLIERNKCIWWSTFLLCFESICDLMFMWRLMPGHPRSLRVALSPIFSLFSEIYNLQMAVNTTGKHTDTNIQQTQNWVPGCSAGVVSWLSSVMSPQQRFISRGPFIMSLAILINFCNQPN